MPYRDLIRDFLKKNVNGITLEQIHQYCVDCGATFQTDDTDDQKRKIAYDLTKMKSTGEISYSGGFWKLLSKKPILRLTLLEERLAVCRLDPGTPIPSWAVIPDSFVSITVTHEELSIVCPESNIPQGVRREGAFRCLKIEGPLDFSEVGIIAPMAQLLAAAGISIFIISTYDTDYILFKQSLLERTLQVLTGSGYAF